MLSRVDALVGAIVRAMVYVATAAGILLSAFVALSAFMRYLVGAPFAFTEEFVGLLFSAMVFLALPYASYAEQHIRVTLLTDHLPPAWRRWSDRGATLLTLVFCGCFAWIAWDFTATSYELHARSDIGRLLLWPWMAAMPVACVFMAVSTLLRALLRHSETGSGRDGL